MSRFNEVDTRKSVTYEGGKAYAKDALHNMLEFMFGNLMGDGFYESAPDKVSRLKALTEQVVSQRGAAFVARLAVYARNEIGMRTAPELVAAWLNNEGFDGKRSFYRQLFRRPDDVAEVLSIVEDEGGKPSHALIRGAADYLATCDEYQLAKHAMSGRRWNLHDVINVCHPRRTPAIDAFQNGRAKAPDTWESMTAKLPAEKQGRGFVELLLKHRLGYLALLRNVNNIMAGIADARYDTEYRDDLLDELCRQLSDGEAIRRSLVWPYQVYVAHRNLRVRNSQVEVALESAFRRSCSNMEAVVDSERPDAVVLDVSGSMTQEFNGSGRSSGLTVLEVSAVYATALWYATGADIVKFADRAEYMNLGETDRLRSPFDIIRRVSANDSLGGGTRLSKAFDAMDEEYLHYGRVFVFSDMQVMNDERSWWEFGRLSPELRSRIQARIDEDGTHFFSFDLGSYGGTPFRTWSPNVHGITSLSDKVFKLVPLMTRGDDAIVNEIESKVKL